MGVYKIYIYGKLKNLLMHPTARYPAFAKRLVLLCIVLCGTVLSNAQLHADFTATPEAGCAPLVVSFADFSSGNPSSWKWDLGNGTVSILRNPSVTYFNPGQYTVKLVVKNSQGADSVIKSQFIKVYASPQVNFSATPQSGCFPLVAKFTDQSLAASGTIKSWEWDFGDGVLSNDQNPQHTYFTEGNYNVSLRIANSFGCISSLTNPQYIQVSEGLHAGFTNTKPLTCNQPATVQFSNTSTGPGVLSYRWQFGDGSISTLENPSHTYSLGTYTVSLIVFNANGCSDTIIKPDLISLGNLKADFSVPPIVCQGSNVSFLNTSKPSPSEATWDFGDGTFSNAINPVKAFANTGTFNVKMIAGIGTCKDSVSKPVQVVVKSKADFAATPTISCRAPLTVDFTNITSQGSTFSWDFGDGTSSNLANPSHTYLKEGFYSVKLVFTNAGGCTDTIEKKDFIKIKSPVVTIDNLPQKGCAPLTHAFTASVNSIDPVTSYLWGFGDGTTSSLPAPTHTYTTPGSYSIYLFYSTASGCTDTARVINGIQVGSKPKVNFSAAPRDVCASSKINFNDLSTGNPDQWLWLFGDGSKSLAKNPEHQYSDSGYFSVTLIATNNGCPDTLVIPKYVHIKAPIARYKYATDCSQQGHVVFTDKSIGANSWQWDFGDGTSSTIKNPSHDYTLSGVYVVQLSVSNNTTGCAYTKTDTVNVLKEIPDFTSNVSATCKNTPVVFNAINSIPANISSYTWKFGDGRVVTSTSNSVSHSYKRAGNYNVTMVLNTTNGCSDSIVKPLAIKVDGPTAVFKTESPGACQNNVVNFIDSSYANATYAIQQWQWNWGDGISQNFSNGPIFQHTYSTAGNYSVSLKVTDNNGCTDSISNVNSIIISQPVASFKADTLSCTSQEIEFSNLSTGPGLKYAWNFGDGTSSTQRNPVHIYSSEGVYSVSLSITDIYGCGDYISKTNYIKIANPKANFAVSDTAGNCPPLVVNFTNTATNYSSCTWNFGDGTTSSSLNPSHFYATPGTFKAVLTVKGPGGCTDQKSVQIKIKGPTGSFTYTNISGCNPLRTNFKATTLKNTTFVWDFNDGTTIVTPDSIVSHLYETAESYLPKMILVDAAGCKVPIVGADSIKVYGVKASFTSPSTTYCDSAKVAFTNTSTTNDVLTKYLWFFGDNSTSILQNPVHTYNATGNYAAQLFVTSKNGCTDSVTLPSSVKIVRSPKIAIGGNSGACTPATLTFNGIISVADTSSLNWKWDFGNGNVSTLQNPAAQTFANTGSYAVHAIAINSSGCTDTTTKLVEAYPLPNLHPTIDTTLCKGASLVLNANDAQTYSWSPGLYLSCANCSNPVSRPDSAIRYFVTGKSGRGCTSTDSVFIDVKLPNTVKVGGPDTLCFGSSLQLSATGAETYSWSPSEGLNNPRISSPIASPGETTTYKVTGSDTKGCFTSTASIPVRVYPIPVINAGPDKTINVTKSYDIVPELSPDVTNVTWTPSTGIIANNYPGISVKPAQTTEYTLEATNEGGCIARDRISIFVMCDNTNVFVPNTFSPNGDGTNDVFYPRGTGVFNIKNLRIFNRWGEVVFEKSYFNANDASVGWDGTYKGKKLSPEVFVYMLEVVCSNNQSLIYKGNVTLIK